MMFKDKVFVNELAATAIMGNDAWNRPTAQPIKISVEFDTDFSMASKTDNLKYSLNYAVISRNIMEFMKINELKNFKSLQNIGEAVSEIVLDEKKGGGEKVEISIKSEKSEIRADEIEYKLYRDRYTEGVVGDKLDSINVKKLRLLTIIGVFTFERLQKQLVDIDLTIELLPHHNVIIHEIMEEITRFVEVSNFKTVEALELTIGQLIFQHYDNDISKVMVRITKPNAISYTEGVGVRSLLTKERFAGLEKLNTNPKIDNDQFNLPVTEEIKQGNHIVYIAFGSNVGDQVKNINQAIDLLPKHDIHLLSTSSMYISKPMYVKDQPDFFNGVIKVQCKHSPTELLKILKHIEYEEIKRHKDYDNGPRSIDLDILLYDESTINKPELTIPHKSMLERTFVLQPLCELIKPDFIHPVSAEPIHNHLKELLKSQGNESIQESNKLMNIVPISQVEPSKNPLKFDHKSKTLMMGILNITPDSFSDGGKSFGDIDTILKNFQKLVDDGSEIIDIGGVSTRPGADEPSESEELNRLLPVFKAIREINQDVLLSIDTYRSEVAKQCLDNGANIINDISMGLYDEKMFDIVAQYQCPYILNHTRGTSKTMSKLVNYEANTNEDLIELLNDPLTGQSNQINDNPEVNNLINGISREQSLQLSKAFKKGVRKWQIILDPGIGFAKNLKQNLFILKYLNYFKKYSIIINERLEEDINENYISFNGLPLLVGTSRKKFLGTLNKEQEPTDRVFSTNATIMACIQQDCNIVRVHDTQEVAKTIRIGDAIYRDIY